MNSNSPRWKEITRSQFAWELEALEFVRERLPDQEPYRGWSNFEFIADDGSINEVDLLLLTPHGFYLIEIKSRGGVLTGDAGTWTWQQSAKVTTTDNPLLLANRKAKKLATLLKRQRAFDKTRTPFLDPVVFCSAPDLQFRLEGAAAEKVYVRDRESSEAKPKGIVASLIRVQADPRRTLIDAQTARALSRAMEEAGIRPASSAKRIGDYTLQTLLSEGPGYQDWQAKHAGLKDVTRRLRLYVARNNGGGIARATILRAAQREFEILEGIEHPGILRARDYIEHELGAALVFDHDPEAQRLDHFLRDNAARLDVTMRLLLLRRIAEAVRYAHDKRLYHRALSPFSILVLDPQSAEPRVQIFNWQTGVREITTSATSGRAVTGTSHLEELIEDPAQVYIAPEGLTDPEADGASLDVFSLGAIAYHLFAGQPPAASFVELLSRLHEGKGLQISAAADGAVESLRDLVRTATHPEVTSRLDSAAEVLGKLDDVEDDLTRPEEESFISDPEKARPGDRLEGGLVLKRRLGQGSTATAFLVEREGRELVLKLALTSEQNSRLSAEADVLAKLRHHLVVELIKQVELNGRVGLLLAKAGDQTLAQRLRHEGRLSPDLLERFGDDLLEAVRWLEQQGIPHRDIKPDNLGIAPMGRGDTLHLVLFDFSLSRAPADRITVGTAHFVDPFIRLRKPPRWDTHAERFAAAVTLYEMATGSLPRWGDGKTEPSLTDVEVTVDADRFDAGLRDALHAFFTKALRRDAQERFDNAEEMLRAWRKAFEAGAAVVGGGAVADDEALQRALSSAGLDDALAELPLTARALHALERLHVPTVRAFLALPLGQLNGLRGAGSKTKRELLSARQQLRARFPEVEEAQPTAGPAEVADAAVPESASVDVIARHLLPARLPPQAKREPAIVRAFLGLDPLNGLGLWPSQTDVARALHGSPPQVNRIVAKYRERWRRLPPITRLRDEVTRITASLGGVATAAELEQGVLAARGSAEEEPLRTRYARAALRAAFETERDMVHPRWTTRRADQILIVAVEPEDEAGLAGETLADYAFRLGQTADRLAADDPLPSPARVLQDLQAVASPEGFSPIAPARLVRLAASTSRSAAASGRLELYPRGMPAVRALKLAAGTFFGVAKLSEESLRERLLARYPEAQPLPARPRLDELLREAELELTWDPTDSTYRQPTLSPSGLTSSTVTRMTALGASPAEEEAHQFEERLRHAAKDGGYLLLVVSPRDLLGAEALLAKTFAATTISIESVFLAEMKKTAANHKVEWEVVVRADAAAEDSRDWRNVLTLADRAKAGVEAAITAASGLALVTRPGILARYRQVEVLERLRDRLSRPGCEGPRALWVLAAVDEKAPAPILNGVPIPVVTPNEWLRVPHSWVRGHEA